MLPARKLLRCRSHHPLDVDIANRHDLQHRRGERALVQRQELFPRDALNGWYLSLQPAAVRVAARVEQLHQLF